MATTLNSIAPIAHPERLFIGGEWVKPSSDSVFEVIAPATEELYLRVAEAQEADMNRAVAAARSAFDSGPWQRMPHAERATFLRALARGLDERAEDVAQTWPNEMGILHSVATRLSGSMGGQR